MKVLHYQRLGRVEYRQAAQLQQGLVQCRKAGLVGDLLLVLEHPPVITMGRRCCAEDFLTAPGIIRAGGIDIVGADRGGRLTYHGPGQLIGYFICDVAIAGGVRRFVKAVEEAIIATCVEFGIEARRDPDHPGVWVGNDKIAAVGFHVTNGITSHGCALNVNNDLAAYRHIVPCGIIGRGVTSMEATTGRTIACDHVIASFVTHSAEVLGCSVESYSFDSAATKVSSGMFTAEEEASSSKTSI